MRGWPLEISKVRLHLSQNLTLKFLRLLSHVGSAAEEKAVHRNNTPEIFAAKLV